MRSAPKTLWVFAALSVAFALGYFLFGDLGEMELSAGWWVFLAVVPTVMLILLLRGSRVVWSLLVFFGGAALLSAPFTGQPWWAISVEVVDLALLLVPSSWWYIWAKRPSVEPESPEVSLGASTSSTERPQATWDPTEQADAERPSGWYVAPDSPGRMRYWDARAGRWLGSAKTPRKITRE